MNEQLTLFAPPTAKDKLSGKLRHIQLGHRIVNYTLNTGRRRLALNIDERGLRVGMPRSLPIADMEAFIRQHGEWVLSKLDEHTSRTRRRQLAIRDGVRIPLLGREIPVRVGTGNNRARWFDGLLELAARPGADLDVLAVRALQRRAVEVFGERLAHYAAIIGLKTLPRLGLSTARTRWGSCSRQTGIRLNWRLIHLPLELVDYVVVHELCHLKEMNHSSRFWAEVAKLCPDWQTCRTALKHQGANIPLI
jgi:hypothetical protein